MYILLFFQRSKLKIFSRERVCDRSPALLYYGRQLGAEHVELVNGMVIAREQVLMTCGQVRASPCKSFWACTLHAVVEIT